MLSGSCTEEKIWNYCKSVGCNDYGAAGVMGNLKQESNCESVMLQITFQKSLGMSSKQYMDAVDNGSYAAESWIKDGAGWGLPQYTYFSLKTEFLNLCKDRHKSIGDLEMQLEYMFLVIKRDCKSLWNTLQNATSVREASNKMLFEFERPGDQGKGQQDKRCGYGEAFYNKYAKGTSEAQKSTQHTLQTALKRSNEVRGTYTTICDLNLRYGADPDKFESMVVMPKGTKAICYGYYNIYENTKWLCVVARVNDKSYTGYCSSRYLG